MTHDDTRAPHDVPVPSASWREWTGLVLLTLPMLALATDISVLFLAMPSISADLQPNSSQMLWILHIYGFLIGGLLITMGRLGDRIGRRKLLMIGAAAFAILAIAAAVSTSPEMLIVVRALLGVAGATLMPSCYSLLRPMFVDEGQRRFAIAAMFGTFALGGAIGPLLGGVLLDTFWWGSVFLVNVPPLLALLAIGPLLLPEHRDETSQRLDLRSVALSLTGMLGVIYGLQEAAEHGAQAIHGVALVLGATLLITFARRQRRLADPLLDLRLFSERRFTISLGMILLTAIGGLAGFYLFTQYLQWVLDLSPLRAGLATLPFVIGGLIGALTAPLLTRWFRQVHVIGAGLLISAVGFALAAAAGGAQDLTTMLIVFGFTGVGNGAAMALGSDLIISSAPAERAGSAAALQEVSGELGTALGVALGGAVGMLTYRATLTSTLSSDLPADAVDAAHASVASGLAAAQGLPGAPGDQLGQGVRVAFAQALQVGLGLGATLIGAVGVGVLVLLRRRADHAGPSVTADTGA